MAREELSKRLWQYQSRYNQWMNQTLFAACMVLGDEDRKRDRGVFFRSIHGTLNHLLLADRIWLGRISGSPFAVRALDQELYSSFVELAEARTKTDEDIITLVESLDVSDLSRPVSYRRMSGGGEAKTFPLAVVLSHLFNHQVHHRGQVTALLSQNGLDYGVTDLIAMPGL